MTRILLLACLVLPGLALARAAQEPVAWIALVAYGLFSLAGFLLIASDKRRARARSRRIPETTLHLVELLGGWPGSYLGQQRFRHKTVKLAYRVMFWTIVLLHQVVAVDALRGWPWLGAFLAILGGAAG